MSLVRFRFWARRCSSMVEHQPSKLNTWVRFPSPALRYRFDIKCASGSVGGARPCQGRGRGFESRLALFLYTKGILKGYLLYINESCRTRTFEVSALLRSVQNRHPPDVVHRLALNQKEVRTDIYARVLPDSNGSYLRSTSVGAGLCFFSFIRDEGVAGAFFSA